MVKEYTQSYFMSKKFGDLGTFLTAAKRFYLGNIFWKDYSFFGAAPNFV